MSGYIIATGGGHLEDALLMQMLDGDVSRSEAREHLADCADCTERYTALEKASRVLHASLPDVPMPHMDFQSVKRRRVWVIPVPIAIAASIVVLASAAAATSPVRQWIMQRFSPTRAPVVDPLPTPTTPPPIQRASVIASFTPTDSVLTIRIERTQSVGALRLLTVAGEKVSAQAEGRTDGEELLVMPTGIRVTNTAASVADYRISVPSSIRSIHVTVAGKETAVVVNDGRLDRRIPVR